MKKPAIDQETLKRLLHYDPETGVFTWLHRADARPQWNGRYAGRRAGYACEFNGGGWYWVVRIFDWPFHAGPLAWLYVTGAWPVNLVDHRDLDGLNNSWGNLREATKAQNALNARRPKSNTSGFKGASYSKSMQRWRATITIGGRQVFLGHFDTAEAAHEAYRAAAEARCGGFGRAA